MFQNVPYRFYNFDPSVTGVFSRSPEFQQWDAGHPLPKQVRRDRDRHHKTFPVSSAVNDTGTSQTPLVVKTVYYGQSTQTKIGTPFSMSEIMSQQIKPTKAIQKATPQRTNCPFCRAIVFGRVTRVTGSYTRRSLHSWNSTNGRNWPSFSARESTYAVLQLTFDSLCLDPLDIAPLYTVWLRVILTESNSQNIALSYDSLDGTDHPGSSVVLPITYPDRA